ncbi:MAG: ABC transporter ATP-binding protein [Microbacteriaceae bacterium]|nr:ABC transporter ATP-binding protein [Microbacteriaceae bacterium]
MVNEIAKSVVMDTLVKTYGSTRALDDFSLAMEPGEMIVLLGPSGCGKTTALRSLAGLESIDSGTITVGGKDLTGVSASKRNMAMVFQAYSLFPHMTAAENVAYGLRVRGVGKARRTQTANEYLELVGLGDQANKYTHQMSGGQQQRVALARALAVQPDVLLLDEPLSALDAKVRVQLRDEIRRIQLETGATTLFVTHDQEEALAVADRVGVMQSGKLQQLASPETVYNTPANGFVASFIGLTNRLPGFTTDAQTAVVYGQRIALLPGSATGKVEVLVRPESVTAVPAASEAESHARVVQASFLGSIARFTMEDTAGRRVESQLPAGQAASLRIGDYVQFQFRDMPALAEAA